MTHKARDEFPLLTPAASRVLLFIESNRHHADSPRQERRRLIADGIRGAMGQTGTWKINSEFPRVIDATELEAIADNLHSRLQAPPTPLQMDEILDGLAAAFGNQIGPEWTSNPFEALRHGIGDLMRANAVNEQHKG